MSRDNSLPRCNPQGRALGSQLLVGNGQIFCLLRFSDSQKAHPTHTPAPQGSTSCPVPAGKEGGQGDGETFFTPAGDTTSWEHTLSAGPHVGTGGLLSDRGCRVEAPLPWALPSPARRPCPHTRSPQHCQGPQAPSGPACTWFCSSTSHLTWGQTGSPLGHLDTCSRSPTHSWGLAHPIPHRGPLCLHFTQMPRTPHIYHAGTSMFLTDTSSPHPCSRVSEPRLQSVDRRPRATFHTPTSGGRLREPPFPLLPTPSSPPPPQPAQPLSPGLIPPAGHLSARPCSLPECASSRFTILPQAGPRPAPPQAPCVGPSRAPCEARVPPPSPPLLPGRLRPAAAALQLLPRALRAGTAGAR